MNGQQSSIDSTDILIWSLLILLCVVFVIPNWIWPNFYIGIWAWVKVHELTAFHYIANWVLPASQVSQIEFYIERLQSMHRTELSWNHARQVEFFTFVRYGWIPTVAIGVMIYHRLNFRAESKGILDMEDLIELQTRKTFRFNRHLIKHNPLSDKRLDTTRGIYAQRMQPIEYCKKQGILTLADSVTSNDNLTYHFNDQKAYEVMEKQLGKEFTRVENLADSEKWILASLLIYLNGEPERYYDFLGDISEAFSISDKQIAKAQFDAVTEKSNSVIADLIQDNQVAAVVKSTLNSGIIGDDCAVITRDLVGTLKKHFKLNQHVLQNVMKLYDEDTASLVGNGRWGANYENPNYLPVGYRMLIYTAIELALGNNEKVTEMLAELTSLKALVDPGQDESDRISEIEDNCDLKVMAYMVKTPGDHFRDAIRKHKYVHGVLLRMYINSENLGVIAASRFTWLKIVNRPLFFTLLDHGLPEHSIETCFIKTHFYSENDAGRKLHEPEVHHQIDELKKRLLEKIDLA